MLTLPDAILRVLHPFATLFRTPTWLKAQILLSGAILAPSQRTVAAARRVRGRSDHLDYARYHEVLNRAVWSPHQAARILKRDSNIPSLPALAGEGFLRTNQGYLALRIAFGG